MCIIPGLPIGNNTIQFMKPKSKSRTYHKLLSRISSNSTKPILIQTDVQKFGDITFYIFISPSVYSIVLDNRQDIMDNWANTWGLELTKLVHGSNPLRAKKPAAIKISEGIMQALSGNDVSTAVGMSGVNRSRENIIAIGESSSVKRDIFQTANLREECLVNIKKVFSIEIPPLELIE